MHQDALSVAWRGLASKPRTRARRVALTIMLLMFQVHLSNASYALGEKDPMCWKLGPTNSPINCPVGLQLDWSAGHELPETVAVSVPVSVQASLNISMDTMTDLEDRGLLSASNPSMTAAEKWALCAVPSGPCQDPKDKDRCCYWHVNIHSCLDKPGVFCGPWVGNDGHLATHTPAITGQAGEDGRSTFNFNVKLFWEGSYTVIVHFRLANMQFAIGKSTTVKFSDAICKNATVPNRAGDCEDCPSGTQPLSLGIPKGGAKLDDSKALELGVNPLCVPCPPGWFSPDGKECLRSDPGYFVNDSWLAEQIPCPAGTSTPVYAATMCISCSYGQFSEQGAALCSLCPKGTYSDEQGRSTCRSCPTMKTTDSMGSVSLASCLCSVGTYGSSNSSFCTSCPKGMTCPLGSDMASYDEWRRLGSPKPVPSNLTFPLLLPRFAAVPSEPLSVYACAYDERCPGGTPGTCGINLDGEVISCAKCMSEMRWNGEKCVECNSIELSKFLFPALPVVAIPLVLCTMYFLTRDDIENWGSVPNGLAALGFIILNHFQISVLAKNADIHNPSSVMVFLRTAIFAEDFLSALSIECTGWDGFQENLLFRTLFPVAIVFEFFLVYLGSHVVHRQFGVRLGMVKDRVVNVYFSLVFTFFAGIVAMSLTVFQCQDNPNGKRTLTDDPSIICGEDIWLGAMANAVLAVLAYVFGFGVLFMYIIFVAPSRFSDKGFRRRWKFLFIKYRADAWWWSSIVCSKTIVMNVGFILLYRGIGQLVWLMACCGVYLGLLMYIQPWRHRKVNVLDCHSNICLMFFFAFFFWWASEGVDADEADRISTDLGILAIVVNLSCVVCFMLVLGLMIHQSRQTKDNNEKAALEIARAVAALAILKEPKLLDVASHLPEWDAACLRQAARIILTEVVGVEGVIRRPMSGDTVKMDETQLTEADIFANWKLSPEWQEHLEDRTESTKLIQNVSSGPVVHQISSASGRIGLQISSDVVPRQLPDVPADSHGIPKSMFVAAPFVSSTRGRS